MKKLARNGAIAVAAAGLMSVASTANAGWEGMYVGANGGIADVTYRLTDVDYDWFGGTMERSALGATLGGTFGLNMQSEGLVYGVETDINIVQAEATDRYDNSVDVSQEMKWSLTVRGRGGLAVSNTLLYLTAGLAVADFDQSWIEDGDPTDSWPDLGDTDFGYATGIGLEHGAWRLELLNLEFGERSELNQDGFNYKVDNSASYVRVGWNFRL